jgi:CHASE2 domain-containing sensor protein
MTSISAIVQHTTTVQQPSPNYRTDEDWAVIPSNIKANDIIDENARLSQRMPYISFVLNFFVIIHLCFFFSESSWLSRHEHFPLACAFALFTIISATVGILVICLTAPKSPSIFSFIFLFLYLRTICLIY